MQSIIGMVSAGPQRPSLADFLNQRIAKGHVIFIGSTPLALLLQPGLGQVERCTPFSNQGLMLGVKTP